MRLRNTTDRWGAVHQAIHWLTALLIGVQLLLGIWLTRTSFESSLREPLFFLHTSTGVTILLLTAFRLYWRLTNPVPALPDTLSPALKAVAAATHIAIYVLLFAMPLIGYLMVSAYGFPTPFFGLHLPQILAENRELGRALLTVHITGAVLLVLILGMHVAGALRHEFVLKDDVLRRMLPFGRRASH